MLDFGSIQIFCTLRLADHRKKPGTATPCKTKDSSCHRQSSVHVLSGNAMINPLVVESLTVNKTTRRRNILSV
jgi:hypothetical protein